MRTVRRLWSAILAPSKKVQILEFVVFAALPVVFAFSFAFVSLSFLKYLSLVLLFAGALNPFRRLRVVHVLFLIPFSSLFHFGSSFGFFTIAVMVCVAFSYASELFWFIKKKERIEKELLCLLFLSVFFVLIALLVLCFRGIDRNSFVSLLNFAAYLFFFVYLCFLLRFGHIELRILQIPLYGFALASLITLPSVFSETFYAKLYEAAGSDHVIVYKKFFFFSGSVRFLAFIGLQTEPNYLGFVMLMCICGFLAFNAIEKKKSWLRISAIAVCVFSGILTLSVTFLICSLLFFSLLLAYKISEMKRRRDLAVLLLLFALGAGVFFLACSPISVSYSMNSLRSFLNDFTTGRSELAILSVEQFCSSPDILFFGNGWNKLQLSYDSHASHSLLFDCLNSVGLLGAITLTMVFFFMGRYLKDPCKLSFKRKRGIILLFCLPVIIELMSLPSFGTWFFLLPFFCVFLPVACLKKRIEPNDLQYVFEI